MRGRAGNRVIGVGAVVGAGVLLWFAFGMNAGVLLSNDIKEVFWPWAPTYPSSSLSSSRLVLSDPVWQFVPWLRLAREELLAGRLPLWNPHQDGGVPLLGNMQSSLGSPLVWPVLLMGVSSGWNLSLLLRLLLALAGTYAWLRDLGRSPLASSLGAVGFSLSGPFVAWLEHPHTITVAAVPLLLLFAGRAARRGTGRDLAGLALATYLVLAGGHPETQLMAALLAAGVVLVESQRRRLLPSLSGALCGAGLAAPLLLPFLEYFRLSQARLGIDRVPFTLPLRDLLRFVVVWRPGSDEIEGAASVSVALLVMVPLGLAGVLRDRRALFAILAAGVMLAVAYESPFSRFLALHTRTYWTRALLILPLPLGYLASTALDALRKRIAVQGHGARATAFAFVVVLVAAGELLAAAQGVHTKTTAAGLSVTTPLLERLREDHEVFRILPLHTFLAPNSATDYGLDDIRGYDALAPSGWRHQRMEIGRFFNTLHQTDIIEPWGLVPGGRALDFWNVKYILWHPRLGPEAETLNLRKGLDLEEIYAGPDGKILRNRRVLPRARIEGGSVRVLARVPTRWVFDVEARADGRLLVANPAFPGWIARVDGRRVPARVSPGDPIEVPVPVGRHRVELLYRPASFWAGCGLAAASACILLTLVLRSRGHAEAEAHT